FFFFFSSRRRHTRFDCDWSSDVCSSDLRVMAVQSKPIQSRTKESAVVSRARLRKQRGAVERWTAWVVLFVSFLGTVVALAGGWEIGRASCRERVWILGGGE